MGEAGRRSAERYAWPHIADEVTEVYERAIEPAPGADLRRRGAPRDGPASSASTAGRGGRPQRLPRLEPDPPTAGGRGRRAARQIGVAVAGVLGLGLTALAARRIGVDQVASSIIDSDLKWVLIACAPDGAPRCSPARPPGSRSPAPRCPAGRCAAAT